MGSCVSELSLGLICILGPSPTQTTSNGICMFSLFNHYRLWSFCSQARVRMSLCLLCQCEDDRLLSLARGGSVLEVCELCFLTEEVRRLAAARKEVGLQVSRWTWALRRVYQSLRDGSESSSRTRSRSRERRSKSRHRGRRD